MVVEKKERDIDLFSRFNKIYSNLPLKERLHVVLVFNNEPISWEIARNEIVHETRRGGEILKKLVELNII